MQIRQIDCYPKALLTCAAKDLHQLFPHPTLLHLQGKNLQPLFISVLLHGNETTGVITIQHLLDKFSRQKLPRSLSIFFGNTRAVEQGLRRLVTLECGWPSQQYGVDHVFAYLNDCIHLSELADHPVHVKDIDIFHTTAQIKIKQDYNFSFSDQQADLLFDRQLERINFTEISAGTCFGVVQDIQTTPLLATDEHGIDVTKQFFKIEKRRLLIKRNTMPSMLTLDERVIRQDCLCYLMERIQL